MKKGSTESLVDFAREVERRAKAKKDVIVNTKDLRFDDNAQLDIAGQFHVPVGRIAHEQIAQHTGIPAAYYKKMLDESPGLLANNVNEWFRKYPAPRMVRMLDDRARAFPSDKYRPLENEDLAQAVIPPLRDLGLDIMSQELTESRMYIKAVDPKVTRELKAHGGQFGDGRHVIVRCLAPAITITNSEVGKGALSIRGGTYDNWCSNLATFGERSMRKYHVGARHELGEDIYAMLSDDTRRVTDAALWAQVGDVVRAAFNRAAFDALVDKIEGTTENKIEGDPVKVVTLTSKRFGMNETDNASVLRHLIEGGDLSQFGLANAITRASQDVDDYDKASDFEVFGGQIIELPATEWKELAKAA